MYENIKQNDKPLIKAILTAVKDCHPRENSCFGIDFFVGATQFKTTETAMVFVVEQLKELGIVFIEDNVMHLTFEGEDLLHKLSA